MNREAPRWWHAELRATQNGGGLLPVKVPAVVPRSAGDGDAMEAVGKATIAPLVKRLLAAIRKGESASPSFEDGMRAQACWTRSWSRSGGGAGSPSPAAERRRQSLLQKRSGGSGRVCT
jgi:hypothetical protein